MESNSSTTLQSSLKCKRCGYSPSGKNRSNQQNSYYWGVIIRELSEHTGYTSDEIHEVLKYKFISYPIVFHHKEIQSRDEEIYVCKSTTELDTKEMEDYLSKIRTWASAELGVWIPEPNESLNG